MLPHNYMFKQKIVTKEQQIEINRKIKLYTNGENTIEWPMVGVINELDIIDRYNDYCNIHCTLFNQMVIEKHIIDVELWRNEIIFNLDGKEMNKLDSKWEYKLAYES